MPKWCKWTSRGRPILRENDNFWKKKKRTKKKSFYRRNFPLKTAQQNKKIIMGVLFIGKKELIENDNSPTGIKDDELKIKS